MEGPDLPDDDPVDGTQPNKDATAAQVFVAEWKKWLQQLQRASTAQEASRKSAGIRPEVAKVAAVESKTEDDCDEDDLLLHLDVERRKELNRISQRRSRANAKIDCEKNRTDSFDNELSAEERVECMRLLRRALGPEGLVECVYVVCDRLVLRAASRRVNDNDKEYLKLMKKNLTVDTAKLPTALLDLYRAPAWKDGIGAFRPIASHSTVPLGHLFLCSRDHLFCLMRVVALIVVQALIWSAYRYQIKREKIHRQAVEWLGYSAMFWSR
ncbi:hypothetical protein JG687_00008526 [Phytophthora cactorum]|uniref:Uncharacterized protein n=1 Tax=Phytophthora cactorum TaxID=29920 RepID=A0A8T1UFA1_9STRA|nr:hypothetical protein JG687_00008526 [Phytophthora cactorum]